MNEGLIPKRYAKALYKFAVERGADAGLYRLMGNLSHSFADNPALNRTIDNPFVEDAKKVELLKTAAHVDENVPATAMKAVSEVDAEVFADFLKLLVENRRLPLAWAASRAYCDIYRKENSIYRVNIHLVSYVSTFHSKPFHHRSTCMVCPPHSESQIAQTSNRKAVLPSPLNSDLSTLFNPLCC